MSLLPDRSYNKPKRKGDIMCAIAGAIGMSDMFINDPKTAIDIRNCLKHRGPDQDGFYISDDAVLIHTRLAIIDIENGTQPMITKENGEEYVIVYNGELYNTDEIRNELINLGYSFKTHSDTEVVLKAFIEWREDAPKRFNGIYGFAVWEVNKKSLFIARDKLGVKPFFYGLFGDKFVFASEIKGILKNPAAKPRVNTEGIAEIILIGPGRTSGYGVFENIHELKPGECGYFKNGKLKTHLYFELKEQPCGESFDEVLEHTKYLVTDAIKRQMVSDVPIGTFLSGGLDSSGISSVVSSALKEKGEQLKTFSVTYKDNDKYFTKNKFQPNSDSEYILLMQKYLNSDHTTVTVDTPMLAEANYRAVLARDLPGMVDVDSSLMLFCEKVKEDRSVVLSGECADEIFGGYPWYRDKDIRMTDGFPWSQVTSLRASLLKEDIKKKINPAAFVYQKYLDTINQASGEFDKTPTDKRMREMYLLNIYWFMQNLLERKDRMSMSCGLEVRVPFCDYRIAEYLYNVPWEYKDYKGREKGLLRKAFEDILPEDIVWRKKSPYPKTHNPSYAAEIDKEFLQMVNDKSSPIFEILDRQELLKLADTTETIYWYGQLMATPQTKAYLLQINYWIKELNVTFVG